MKLVAKEQMLKQQLAAIDRLRLSKRFLQDFESWKIATEVILRRIFGENSKQLRVFSDIRYSPVVFEEPWLSESRMRVLDKAESCLLSMVDDIGENNYLFSKIKGKFAKTRNAVSFSRIMEAAVLVIAACALIQDRGSNIASNKWQERVLSVIMQINQKLSTFEQEKPAPRKRVRANEGSEAPQRAAAKAAPSKQKAD